MDFDFYNNKKFRKSKFNMEVKMFLFNEAENAEEQINGWLKENTVRIQYISQSHCERNGRLLLIVSIYYAGL